MPKLTLKGESIGVIKGVLFDKDGTLTNSENNLRQLASFRVNETISTCQKMELEEQDIFILNKSLCSAYGLSDEGLTSNGCVAIASRQQNLFSTATILCVTLKDWASSYEIATTIFKKVDDILLTKSKPKRLLPGAKDLLNRLREAELKCAIISNDSEEGIDNFLKTNNLIDNFSGVWSADHSPAKPDKGAVFGICKQLGLQPQECALIGDADSDLGMAHQAGVQIILGYTAGWSTPPKLKFHQHLIHHWNDLTTDQSTRFSYNIQSNEHE